MLAAHSTATDTQGLTTRITGPRVEHYQNNKKHDRAAPLHALVRRRPVQLEIHSQSFFSISSSILYA